MVPIYGQRDYSIVSCHGQVNQTKRVQLRVLFSRIFNKIRQSKANHGLITKTASYICFTPLFFVVPTLSTNSVPISNYDARSSSQSIELFLSNPLAYAKPDNRCELETCKRLLSLIRGAKTNIEFAVYGMRNQTKLLEALVAAKKRGVIVRGVVDRYSKGLNYYASTDLWVNRLLNVRDDKKADGTLDSLQGTQKPYSPSCDRPLGFAGPVQCLAFDLGDKWLLAAHASEENFVDSEVDSGSNRLMHNKFFIIDQRWVWTGSSNISDSDIGGYNANADVVTDSPQLAAIYSAEFAQFWSGKFHTLKKANGVERLNIGGTETTVWFSPTDEAMRFGVEALIAKADERIDISVFYLTDKYVTADLIAAHRRGVIVRVIVDATSATNGYSKHEILRKAGIAVKVENWGGKMHMKAASFDGQTIVIGSMNWTGAGNNTNDENTLVFRSSNLVSQYESFFEYLWGTIPNVWSQLNSRPDPESLMSSTACTDNIDNDFDKMVDAKDPGCSAKPPKLHDLPPYWIIEKSLKSLPKGYRLYEGLECDPSYPDYGVCIPMTTEIDLDCDDIPYKSFTVIAPDPQRFDSIGKGNGLGCES